MKELFRYLFLNAHKHPGKVWVYLHDKGIVHIDFQLPGWLSRSSVLRNTATNDYYRAGPQFDAGEVYRGYLAMAERPKFFHPESTFIEDTLAIIKESKIDWADLLLRYHMLVHYAHPVHGIPSYEVIGKTAEQVHRFINRTWGTQIIELPRVKEKAA